MFIKIDCNLTQSLYYGKYEFHIAKMIRVAYGLSDELFSITGNVIFENVTEIRKFIQQVNKHRVKMTNYLSVRFMDQVFLMKYIILF